jgi:formylglycine-generating enzyme required for sulfatase activity
MRLPVLAVLCLLLAACGSDPGPGPTGELAAHQAETRAAWQVLDLRSGRITPLDAPPADVAGDPAWRGPLLLLRLVRDATGTIGQQPGSFVHQEDEVAGLSSPAPYAIAVLETTRAQWRLIAGSAPWETLLPEGVRGSGGDDLPATGVSWAEADAALAAWSNNHGLRLTLPTPAEWEVAARAGGRSVYPWGDLPAAPAVDWVVCAETVDPAGPRPVGTRLANALGLVDVIGNAAELVSDGSARGGSWIDPLALTRAANRLELESATRHAGVGLRLVYRP